jgi:cytidine deaminase
MALNDEMRKKLIEEAVGVRHWAYAPYSQYRVGAALLASSGKIYLGVNVENAAYPTSMCAERTACFRAITEGERQFTAIVVATENGGMPCGACRQVLSEFGLDLVVIIADKEGKILKETSLKDLLPGAFLPGDLPDGKP